MNVQRPAVSGAVLWRLMESQPCSDWRYGITVNPKTIGMLPPIDKVLIIGSSATGKTTLVEALRTTAELTSVFGSQPVVFPRRYITRPQRHGDNLIENQPVNPKKFDELVKSGEIDVWWSRQLGQDRTERYGFESMEPGGEKSLAIYSANNAIINSPETCAVELVTRALILQVFAPEHIRKQRITERSPDLTDEEVNIRISDNGINLLQHPRVHAALSFYEPYTSAAIDAAATMIRVLNTGREAAAQTP